MNTISPSEQLQDAELVCLVRQGDCASYGTLVQRHQSAVCGVAYAVCGDFSLSEDLAQEAFVCAWKQLAELTEAARFRPWVCGIARKLALSHLRKQLRRGDSVPSGESEATVSAEPAPNELATSEEEKQLLWRVLDSLPATYREPLVLFYREQESVAAVAAALDLSEANVKQRLSRGRDLMREALALKLEGVLLRTRPGSVFTLAVMGSLPATLAGAGLLAGASTAKAATSVSAAKVGGVAASAPGGAVFGFSTAGAILATSLSALVGLLWAYLSVRLLTAPWMPPAFKDSFKKLALRSFVVTGSFALGVGWLGWTQGGPLLERGIPVWTVLLAMILLAALAQFFLTLQAVRVFKNLHLEFQTRYGQSGYGASQRSAAFVRRQESKARFLGMPLLSIAYGPDAQRGESQGLAKGWLAFGDQARGGLLAVGGIAVAPVAIGGVSLGLLSMGGLSLGGLALGGMTLGWVSFGGIALGWTFAAGGVALSLGAGLGGIAVAKEWALGGAAFATHANDAKALDSFRSQPWIAGFLRYLPYAGLLSLIGVPALVRFMKLSRSLRRS